MFHLPPSQKGQPTAPACRLPELADVPQPEEPTEETYAGTELATFKVFLKRNLRPQAPPAELLGKIRARIEEISAAK